MVVVQFVKKLMGSSILAGGVPRNSGVCLFGLNIQLSCKKNTRRGMKKKFQILVTIFPLKIEKIKFNNFNFFQKRIMIF